MDKFFTHHKNIVIEEKSGKMKDYLNELRKRYQWSNPSSSDYTKDQKPTYVIKEDPDEKDKRETNIEVGPLMPGNWVPDDLLTDDEPVSDTSSSTGYFDIINNAVDRSLKYKYVHNDKVIPITENSNGQCTYGPSTFYKELNLQGSFWDTNDPETASSTNIGQKGFDMVWKGNYEDVQMQKHILDLKPGDLMVTYGVKSNGKNSSHIAMWNGKQWISDFRQKGPLVYNKERFGKSGKSVELYRLNPNKIKMGKTGMKLENNDEDAYRLFLATLPPNLKNTDPKEYRMHRYWELHGKPFDFWSAIDKSNMFSWDKKDKAFHANSVALNQETGEYEFMKAPDHSTTQLELDWYNKGLVHPSEGEPFYLTPEHGEDYDFWVNFKDNFDLDDSGEFYKYVPKKKESLVQKDEQGAKIIVIEKEVIKEPDEEKDPLGCLLCQIMNAMGHRHHAFSELRPDKLTDIFGGDAEIVIQLGGPEKAYNEDLFEEMLKDILPLVSTSKKYSKDDIKEIRSKKAEHGTSMKRLLSLMDDDKILKAFHGMQLFKTGGEIQFEADGGQLNGMKPIKIEIGEKEFSVYEAKTDEEKTKGLNGVSNLKEDEGMIFYWDEPQTVSMTMKDCDIPLLMCFFDEDYECISIHQAKPHDKESVSVEGVKFVVELYPSADIKIGDELDLPGDDDEYVMQVLGSDGSIQMQLKGGERIFSRPNTKILLKWAKKAYNSNDSSDYRRLGKLLFKYLDEQDNREPEYVQLDSKN